MSISIDFGVYEIRSLRYQSTQLVSRKVRSVYATIPVTSERVALLKKLGITYAVCDGSLVIIGEAAEEYAEMFQVPVAPLLPACQVPIDDPPARQILSAIVDSLVPPPAEEGEICCMTLPVNSQHRPRELGESNRFLEQLIRLKGYQPLVISAGTAVVLADMADCSFTGIGMSMGAGSCELSLTRFGEEVACCSVLRGGDWIDRELAQRCEKYAWDVAGNQYLNTDRAMRWKENGTFSLAEPRDEQEQLLTALYSQLLSDVLQQAASQFSRVPDIASFPQPLSLVCAGGMTRMPGFEQLLRTHLHESPMPLTIDNIRIDTDSTHAIARGCLIRGELESGRDPGMISAA